MAMQLTLIVTVSTGLTYFLLVRRRLDAFSVAYFSATLYFLPGLVGYTLSPTSPRSPIKLPVALEPEATAIMVAVITAIAITAALWDRIDGPRPPPRWVLESATLATYLALAIGITGVGWTVLESGSNLLSTDKLEVIAVIGRGHLVWEMGASLAATLAYAQRQKLAGVGAWLLLTLDMLLGFRYAFAMTFIAVGLLALSRPEPYRLASVRLRYWILILAGGLLVVSYQNLKEPLRAANWNEISERVTNPLWYVNGVLTSEPFTTQTVLNEIVRNDFRTSSDHLLSASRHLMLFSMRLDDEAVRFNNIYQPALFPYVDHGLANNIWGQMWSAGDWPLLLAFMLVFVAGLALLSRILRSGDPLVRSWAALAIAFWAFYAHRNELLGLIGFQKQLFLVWGACVLTGIMSGAVARWLRATGTEANRA